MKMKDTMLTVLDSIGQAHWIEVHTEQPQCTYYFGPFMTEQEATGARSGYCEDLEHEGAQGIRAVVKRCKPKVLTVVTDTGEWPHATVPRPAFSS
jgi:hypothetical protein